MSAFWYWRTWAWTVAVLSDVFHHCGNWLHHGRGSRECLGGQAKVTYPIACKGGNGWHSDAPVFSTKGNWKFGLLKQLGCTFYYCLIQWWICQVTYPIHLVVNWNNVEDVFFGFASFFIKISKEHKTFSALWMLSSLSSLFFCNKNEGFWMPTASSE